MPPLRIRSIFGPNSSSPHSVTRSADIALPQAATRPPSFAVLRAVARILPPTVSTTPAQRPFCSGLPEVSLASPREKIVFAGLPGGGDDFVAQFGENGHGDAAHAPGGAGDQHFALIFGETVSR